MEVGNHHRHSPFEVYDDNSGFLQNSILVFGKHFHHHQFQQQIYHCELDYHLYIHWAVI